MTSNAFNALNTLDNEEVDLDAVQQEQPRVVQAKHGGVKNKKKTLATFLVGTSYENSSAFAEQKLEQQRFYAKKNAESGAHRPAREPHSGSVREPRQERPKVTAAEREAFFSEENREARLLHTTPCHFAMRRKDGKFGACTKADCTYAHSLNELRVAPCLYKAGCIHMNSNKPCLYFHDNETMDSYLTRTKQSLPDLPEERQVAKPTQSRAAKAAKAREANLPPIDPPYKKPDNKPREPPAIKPVTVNYVPPAVKAWGK